MAISFAPQPKKTVPKPAPKPVKKRAPGAGRPKADDPLMPVNLRIPQSWLDEWAAKGEDWRALMRERLRP